MNYRLLKKINILISHPTSNPPKIKIVGSSAGILTHLSNLKNGQWELSVTLPEDFPLGPISGRIILELSTIFPPIKIPLLGKVIGDAYASPDELYFGIINVKERKNYEIEVRNRKGSISDAKIDFITPSLKEFLQTKIKRLPNGSMVLVIGISSKLKDNHGLVKGIISLKAKTDNDKTYRLNIPVLGIVEGIIQD